MDAAAAIPMSARSMNAPLMLLPLRRFGALFNSFYVSGNVH
jgi:hypothetical protein